jgi:tagatose 6-phosphate kinase
LAEREHLDGEWTGIEAETRCATIVADDSERDASVINEPGPHVTPDEWQRFAQSVARLARASHAVTFSGSAPSGPTPERFALLLKVCAEQRGAEVWVDSSGEWLRAAATVPGVNLKMNGEEIAALTGRAITDTQDAARTARQLRAQRGLRRVIITLGKRGAGFAGVSGAWVAHAPEVSARSSVGSGDCFLGAMALALCNGSGEGGALSSAVAAGVANAMSIGGGQFSLGDYHDALIRVRPVQVA